jgi:hypothetical protein
LSKWRPPGYAWTSSGRREWWRIFQLRWVSIVSPISDEPWLMKSRSRPGANV